MQQINKKRKFNVIDLLITAIILVVIVFVAYIFIFSGKSFGKSDTEKIQYTLEVREERDELIEPASQNIGKTLIEGTSKYNLGEVVDFYSEGAKYSTYAALDGSSTVSDYPEHSNLYFVVNADAVKDSETGRYSINGFEVSVGSLIYLRLPHFAGTSYCIEVNEIEE